MKFPTSSFTTHHPAGKMVTLMETSTNDEDGLDQLPLEPYPESPEMNSTIVRTTTTFVAETKEQTTSTPSLMSDEVVTHETDGQLALYHKFPEPFNGEDYEWDLPLPKWGAVKSLVYVDENLQMHLLSNLVKSRSGRKKMKTIMAGEESVAQPTALLNGMRVALIQHERWKTVKLNIDRKEYMREKKEEEREKREAIAMKKKLEREEKKRERQRVKAIKVAAKLSRKIEMKLEKEKLKEEKRLKKQREIDERRRKQYEERRKKLAQVNSSDDSTSDKSSSSSSDDD